MIMLDITHQRLRNQHIAGASFERPEDVVHWLGAVQSQDYGAAKWALGLRLPGTIDRDIERAFAEGAILRTHVMRPTWHFVSPEDIRWLLALTAPRVNASCASNYRRFELDDAVFRQCNVVLTKALEGGKQLTRAELASRLEQAGIAVGDGVRLAHIFIHAELDGLICSGARRGKQFTYALLEERVPPVNLLERDTALAEFARRYFTSHGPATLQDFVWWSGLAVTDARAGLAMVTSQLAHEVVDGQTYWFAVSTLPAKALTQEAHLLPNFDEYMVGYKERSAIFDASHTKYLDSPSSILTNTMVLHGQIVGTWRHLLQRQEIILTPHLFTELDEAAIDAFAATAQRYSMFLELPVSIAW
jgi:hypothetical protein